MLGLTIFLVAGAALAHAVPRSPPYVQAREAYTHARTIVSQALPPHRGGFDNPMYRKDHAYGILAGVVGGLVAANRSLVHPLHTVYLYVPYSWRNYRAISLKAQDLLNEASGKISPIEDLINNLCDSEGIEQCNAMVEAKVEGNPHAYSLPAELLLALGKVSRTIRNLEHTLESVAVGRTEIPYLINNVNTHLNDRLVNELKRVYEIMKRLQFRRFFLESTTANRNKNRGDEWDSSYDNKFVIKGN